MGACSSKQHDTAYVFDSVRIRFPAVPDLATLVDVVAYAVAKTQRYRSSAPTNQRHEEVLNIVDLMVRDVASEDLRAVYDGLGGRTFVAVLIVTICRASRGKKVSAGI